MTGGHGCRSIERILEMRDLLAKALMGFDTEVSTRLVDHRAMCKASARGCTTSSKKVADSIFQLLFSRENAEQVLSQPFP